MANLVIVESPAKAGTIKGYLGSNYKVVASKGHVRDLPKSTLGVDIENNFEPHYINIRGKGDLINDLRKEAKSAGKVFLATDPDREGEAISWHLATALGISPDSMCRVTFNEITKDAIKTAIKSPRKIDMNLVNAQQARRILDRIVGYNLSPFLWKYVRGRLSAGRVQSVATRLVAERENEIKDFKPVEYYTVSVIFRTANGEEFTAKYYDEENKRYRIPSKAEADAVLEKISRGEFTVSEIKSYDKQKNPAPPFTTSTLQQEASKRLGFSSHKTMKVAQELYEGVNLGSLGTQGLITYMRTDSLRIAASAQESALAYISSEFGESYVPKNPRQYKTKAGAQDAHEAIRPSHIDIVPSEVRKHLSPDNYKLYKLIWERFMASQMSSAVVSTTSVNIVNSGYSFRMSCDTVKFPGYMALYVTDNDNDPDDSSVAGLPKLSNGQKLTAEKINGEQHFTEPPARYTEATLIKCLEENGIGRPSTYAPTITTILSRDYVRYDGKFLTITPLGEITTKLMMDSFPEIVDYEFTASMENKLDEIENGKESMPEVLGDFYKGFKAELDRAESTVKHTETEKLVEVSEYTCEKCGKPMVYKNGRFGRFLACSDYPQCKNTVAVDSNGKPKVKMTEELVKADFACPDCGGDVFIRHGRYGDFYSCSNYPKCKYSKPVTKDIGVPCPKCGGRILARVGLDSDRYSCENYPTCDFNSWDRPTNEKCPQCGEMLYYKKLKNMLVCKKHGCKYSRPADENNER